jgi:hypothetical protein
MPDEIFHPFNIVKIKVCKYDWDQTCAILASAGKKKYR